MQAGTLPRPDTRCCALCYACGGHKGFALAFRELLDEGRCGLVLAIHAHARLLQLGVKLHQVTGAQFVQLDVPDCRRDARQQPFVIADRLGL